MASLVFLNGPYAGKSLQIAPEKVIVAGRNRNIELPLPDLKLSRKHCQFSSIDGVYIVQDLGSTNGTYLNGKRLEGGDSERLSHFDRVVIGDTELEFQCPEKIDEEQTRVGIPAPQNLPTSGVKPIVVENGEDVGIKEVDPPAEIAPPEGISEVAIPEPIALPAIFSEAPEGVTEGKTVPQVPPLEIALIELDKPLPPDPDPEQDQMEPLEERPQLLFCDFCDGSIAVLDLDLGEAKEISGKLVCKGCLEKGITVGDDPQGGESEGESQQDIDEILKGLGDVEEVAFEGGREGTGDSSEMEDLDDDLLEFVAGDSKPGDKVASGRPPPPPVKQKDIDDLLGDDFEEID